MSLFRIEKEKIVENCRNCGAPITDRKCHYCGTIYEEQERKMHMVLYRNGKPVSEDEMEEALCDVRSLWREVPEGCD